MLVSSSEVRSLSLAMLLCTLSQTGLSAGLLTLSHLFSLPRTQMQLAGGTGHGKLDRGVKGRRLLLAIQGGLPSLPWKPHPLL